MAIGFFDLTHPPMAFFDGTRARNEEIWRKISPDELP
jgi:hypothetical protein